MIHAKMTLMRKQAKKRRYERERTRLTLQKLDLKVDLARSQTCNELRGQEPSMNGHSGVVNLFTSTTQTQPSVSGVLTKRYPYVFTSMPRASQNQSVDNTRVLCQKNPKGRTYVETLTMRTLTESQTEPNLLKLVGV